MPMSPGVKIEEIAKKTEGYTGADLQAILYNAQMLAAKPVRFCFFKPIICII